MASGTGSGTTTARRSRATSECRPSTSTTTAASTSRPTVRSSRPSSNSSRASGPRYSRRSRWSGTAWAGLSRGSACHYGDVAGHAWRHKVRSLVCIGSPHHGHPLERGGNLIGLLLGISRYSAPLARLGKIRRAGVTDLRFGERPRRRLGRPRSLRARAWPAQSAEASGRRGVLRHRRRRRAEAGRRPRATAWSLSRAPSGGTQGRSSNSASQAHQRIVHGVNHLDLLGHPEVYETVRSWLAAPA